MFPQAKLFSPVRSTKNFTKGSKQQLNYKSKMIAGILQWHSRRSQKYYGNLHMYKGCHPILSHKESD